MKTSILAELDCVGNRAIAIRLDPSVFAPDMIVGCAKDVVGLAVDETGVVTVAPNDAAFGSLKQFCARLLAAKLSLL